MAAVLGVIKTMAAINEPPEILGKMIGSALVGTFLGVWLGYAFVGPIRRCHEIARGNQNHVLQMYQGRNHCLPERCRTTSGR